MNGFTPERQNQVDYGDYSRRSERRHGGEDTASHACYGDGDYTALSAKLWNGTESDLP